MAVNGVNNTQVHKPQRKVAKAIAGTVATAALVSVGLAISAKNGKFAVSEESSAVAKKVLPHLEKAGKAIYAFATETAAKVTNSKAYQTAATKMNESGAADTIREGFKKGQGLVDDLADKVKSADIKGKAQAGLEKGKGFVETLVSKAKALFNKETVVNTVETVVDSAV